MHYNFIYFSLYRSLYDCGVEDQATVRMISLSPRHPMVMVLFVKCLNGDIFHINAERSDKIINVKTEIQRNRGLDPAVQVLIWAGQELLNEKTLEEYDIGNQFTIYLMVRQAVSNIFVQTLNGQTIKLKVMRKKKSVFIARNLLFLNFCTCSSFKEIKKELHVWFF